MRTYNQVVPGFTIFEHQSAQDGAWLYDRSNTVNDFHVRNLSRSGVTKVQPIQGWRQPTGYTVRFNDTQKYSGYAEVQRFNASSGVWLASSRQHGEFARASPDVSPSMGYHSANTKNRLEIRALLKARDQKVNLSLIYAEAAKTSDLIFDRLVRLARGYELARKGQFKSAANAMGARPGRKGKGTANSWLELQYGWMPLLVDIQGAYEETARRVAESALRFRVVAQQRDVSKTVVKRTWDSNFALEERREETIERTSKVVLWYEVQNPALLAASQVGLINPLEIAWEVTPFSFLVDWVVPIGDFFGALTAATGLAFKGGTYTQQCRGSSTGTIIPVSKTAGGALYKPTCMIDHAYDMRYWMDRTVYSSSPIPVPYIKNPVSGLHVLNALALLRSIF